MDLSKIIQPDILVFGVRIMEPVTSMTDLLVAATCFYAFWRLRQEKVPGKVALYIEWYFITMGVATFLGGMVGHAFIYALSESWKLPGWFISMGAVALLGSAAIGHADPLISPALGKAFLVMNTLALPVFMVFAGLTLHFQVVQAHVVFGVLVVVFSCHLFTYIKTGDAGSKIFLQAIGVLALAGFVFNYPVVLHKWFNNRDLSHVLMALVTLLILKGTLRLGEEPVEELEVI